MIILLEFTFISEKIIQPAWLLKAVLKPPRNISSQKQIAQIKFKLKANHHNYLYEVFLLNVSILLKYRNTFGLKSWRDNHDYQKYDLWRKMGLIGP